MRLAFICQEPTGGEWTVLEVEAKDIEQGWLVATIEAGKLGFSKQAIMNFLGHSC